MLMFIVYFGNLVGALVEFVGTAPLGSQGLLRA